MGNEGLLSRKPVLQMNVYGKYHETYEYGREQEQWGTRGMKDTETTTAI